MWQELGIWKQKDSVLSPGSDEANHLASLSPMKRSNCEDSCDGEVTDMRSMAAHEV